VILIMQERIAKALKETIFYWKKVIDEVRSYPDKKATIRTPNVYHNEWWDSRICILCLSVGRCTDCPLYKKYGLCSDVNSENAWSDIAAAKDWVQWIKHAERMLRQLESLVCE